MSIVVDGHDWSFDGRNEQDVADLLDRLLGRIEVARSRDETVWIGDELQIRSVYAGKDIWSLFSPDSPIKLPHHIWQELSAWLSRAPRYADEQDWPSGFDETSLSVDGAAYGQNADAAWAHHHVRSGNPVACLGITTSGPRNTVSALGAACVHWIVDESTHRNFWRNAIDVKGDNALTLECFASHAFPDLFFVNGVWGGLGRLAGGYSSIRKEVRQCLAHLDDYGRWAFTFPPPALAPNEPAGAAGGLPTNQIIEKRFNGLNLTVAPENPNVFLNRLCRQAREVEVGGRVLYCEWHQKFEPHRNRLHIHAPVAESDDKVIIAIFDEHLPLP